MIGRAPPVSWLTASFVAVAALAAAGMLPSPVPLAPIAALLAVLAFRHDALVRAVACAALAGWLAGAGGRGAAARSCTHVLDADRPAAFTGHFTARPGRQRRTAPFHVRDGPGGCRGTVTVVVGTGEPVAPGVAVRISGRWLAAGPGASPGTARLMMRERSAEGHGRSGTLSRWRTGVEDRLAALFPRRWPLVQALVLARKADLDPDLRDAFAATGLAHLLAISGFHVGVVAALLAGVAGALGTGARGRAAVATTGTWAYVLSIGVPDAAVRAAVFLTVALLSRMRGRPVHGLGALSAALLVMVAVDPLALSRVGLQLSFAGAAGLTLLSRPIERWLERGPGRRLPRSVRSALGAGTAATVFTTPLVAWHFETVSLVGIPATLVAGPLVAAAIPGILATLATSVVSGPLASFLAGGVEWILDALVAGVMGLSAWPLASVPTTRTSVAVVSTALLVSAALVPRGTGAALGPGGRRAVLAGVSVAALVGWPALSALLGPGTLQVTVLDVGQGDALAIRSPRGRWVVVDAGPRSDRWDAGARVVVPFLRSRGVRRLDALVLTHPDLDHIGGADAVLQAIPVEVVLDPGVADGRPAFVELLAEARERDVPWLPVRRGRALDLDGVELLAVHPPADAGDPSLSSNDRSVVLLLRYGRFRMLLTGDAEAEAERRMLEDGLLGPVDVLKVGHHGSATSTTPDLVHRIRPAAAVIPVGHRNRYGHPDPDVVRRLETSGATLLRTDLHGWVRITARKDGRFDVASQRGGHSLAFQ